MLPEAKQSEANCRNLRSTFSSERHLKATSMNILSIWCLLVSLSIPLAAHRCGVTNEVVSVCVAQFEEELSDWNFPASSNSSKLPLDNWSYYSLPIALDSLLNCCNKSDVTKASKRPFIECFGPGAQQALLNASDQFRGNHTGNQVVCTVPWGEPGERLCQLPDGDFFMVTTDSEVKSCVENLLSLQINASKFITVICEEETFPLRFEDVFTNDPDHVATMVRFFPWVMLSSSIFLLFTIVVYITIGRCKTPYDQVLLCHLGALLVLFMGYMVVKFRFMSRWYQKGNDDLASDLCSLSCILFGIGAYFSYLSAFMWGGLASLDLWITYGLFIKKRLPRIFRLYFFCGVGFPLFMTSLLVVLDTIPYLPENIVRPGIVQECWITVYLHYDDRLLYLFVPLGIIIGCNLLLFLHTTAYFLHDVSTTATARGSGANAKKLDKRKYFVVMQIFFIMGIGWVIDVITWASKAPSYLRLMHEVVNISRGVVLFIILIVCKPDIRKQFLQCCKSAVKKLECGKP